jgi:hypothetical protein
VLELLDVPGTVRPTLTFEDLVRRQLDDERAAQDRSER